MESISIPFATLVMQVLGLPGLMFIMWYIDQKRLEKQWTLFVAQQQLYRDLYEKEQRQHRQMYEKEQQSLRESYDREHRADRDMTLKILGQYKEDVNNIAGLYKNNVHLVTDYERAMLRLEKFSEEMMSVVTLNAQASSNLAAAIKNNTFCPQVRNAQGSL